MAIELLIQPKSSDQCGQHVMAMLTNRSIEEIFELYGTRGATNMRLHERVLNELNIKHSKTKKVDNRKKDAIKNIGNGLVRIKYGQRKMGHVVLYYNGKVYDSSNGLFNGLEHMLRYYNNKFNSRVLVSHYLEIEHNLEG